MVSEHLSTEPVATVLLTRFNLPSRGYESLVRSSSGWLEERVALFERFCIPSLKAQSDQQFVWIIYFDPQSPAWLMNKIQQWQALPQLKPVFRDEVMLDDMRLDFEQALGYRPRRLLTSNLDNDDAIGRHFLSRLKALAPEQGRTALFLKNGLVVRGDRLFLNTDPDNAFCSVIEDWEGFVTCWVKAHNQLKHKMPVIDAGGQPGWLQVIHNSNVSNRTRGWRVSPQGFADEFPALDIVPVPSRRELLVDRSWHQPKRLFRELGRAATKKVVMLVARDGGIDRAKIAKHAVVQALRRLFTILPDAGR